MQEILRKALHYKPEQVTPDQFHTWKQDPITQELMAELAESVLEQLSDDLPPNPDLGLVMAYQRDGAQKMLDIIWHWIPGNVKKIKEGDSNAEND